VDKHDQEKVKNSSILWCLHFCFLLSIWHGSFTLSAAKK